MSKETLAKSIREIPDFPIPGILFYDVTTLFKDPARLQELSDTLYEMYKDKGITKVVGIESRGFIMGPILATRLGAGFIPIRKPGKLPAETIEESYDKEYGKDTIQIHKDALNENDVVLLHDDLLATGGTMEAACKLVQKMNPKRIHVNFIIELKELHGKDLFNKENVEKVVSAVTGKNTVDMTGTWSYTGSAIEFESDNLLMKAGGAVAATTAEAKLNEQLSKVGIKPGQMSFTFAADSTFNVKLGAKTLKGTYTYDATEKHVVMKFVKLINMNAKVNCTSGSMDLLFESDKLLKLITFLSSKSSNATLKTISSLANSYDGMMLGFSLEKKE